MNHIEKSVLCFIIMIHSTHSTHTVQYSNNTEYRQVLRRLFQMQSTNHETNVEEAIIDDETKDELDYDDTASSEFLNNVYEKTKHKKEFQKLFDLAAACMFSTDREIGLAVLFSYDYLALFYQVLELNTIDPSNISESAPYQKLLQGLSRTPNQFSK